MSGSFFSAWCAGEPRARAWLPSVLEPAARQHAVRRAAGRRVSPALVEALRASDAALPESASRRAALDALAAGGSAVVVTGQQAGLFLGPLYTLYKAATAVALARALEAESGVRCVPLFWLQLEDHDFAEIASCRVHHPALAWSVSATGVERASVAHRRLGPEVARATAQLEEALAPLPHGAEVARLLGRAYAPGVTPGSAFAQLLAALFADEGLLLLDPRQPAIAQLSAPLWRRALSEAARLDERLAERSRALASAGFGEQVPLRPGTSLVFLHADGPEGPRHRLVRDGAAWTLPDGRRFSDGELAALAEREPRCFSSSALLRPIVQDALLPTVAYVGGPAEIAYLAQSAAAYPIFGPSLGSSSTASVGPQGVEPALAAPRARFRLIEPPTRASCRRLGVPPGDVERPREVLLRQLATPAPGLPAPDALEAALVGPLAAQLEALAPALAALDPGLARAAARTRATAERAARRLAGRYARTLAARDGARTEQLDRLQAALFPDGAPQERVHSFVGYAARFGARALVERVLAAVRPFEPLVQDLELT